MITIKEQLAGAQRELALRKRVYPKWIATRGLSQEKADKEIAVMEAIVVTLQKLSDLEDVSNDMQQSLKL